MTKSRCALACAVVLFWALGCTLPAVSNAAELLVQRDAGLSAHERADLRADAGVTFERTSALPRTELVSVPDSDEQAALIKLNADPHVAYAAPNITFHTAGLAVPPLTNDPGAYLQWDFESPTTDADIDLSSAWRLNDRRPGAGVDVAVVDQLVHQTHEDFAGQIDTEDARDFVQHTDCSENTPLVDHGTHIAGTIAAKRDNARSTAGVAPYARILPVQAFDNCGDSDLETIKEAFRYAAGKANIVTGSFASNPLNQSGAGDVNDAFLELLEEFPDTLFVVAAGNEGSDNSELPVYPCDTRLHGRSEPPNLICVAMSDDHDRPSCQSNVRGSADVFAPGVDIWAPTGTGRGFEWMTGTSQAAAVVAGVAALAEWDQPGATGDELKNAIMMSADPVPGMDGLVTSNGRVNAARALGVTTDEAGHDLGRGGPGGTWASCDADHDGVRDSIDDCPTRPGAASSKGCGDPDGDGLLDNHDNCPDKANPDQADMDGDGFGDLCDGDQDGDSRLEALDVCPRQYALTANGCPVPEPTPSPTVVPPAPLPSVTPVPTPEVTPEPTPVAPAELKVTIAVKVSRQVARVTVKPTRTAKFSIRVDRLVHNKWKRLTTRSLTAGAAGKVFSLKRLAKGKYRVTATTSGIKKTTKTFRV